MKHEKGSTIAEYVIGLFLIGIVAVFLLSLIPQQMPDAYIPNWGDDYSEIQTEWANLSNNVIATGEWDLATANVSLGEDNVFVPEENNHAELRHKEAKSIREWMYKNCNGNDVKEFIGKNEKNGFRMFVCKMADGKHFAVYIVVDAIYSTVNTNGKPFAEITCFLSRSWSYIQSVIDKGWYLPIQ